MTRTWGMLALVLMLAGCGSGSAASRAEEPQSSGGEAGPTAQPASGDIDARAVENVKVWTCYMMHAYRYGYRCRMDGVVVRRTASGWEWGVLRDGSDVTQVASVETAESATEFAPVPAAQAAQLERALTGTPMPAEQGMPPSDSSLLVRIQLGDRTIERHFPDGHALFDAAAPGSIPHDCLDENDELLPRCAGQYGPPMPEVDHEAAGSADLREVATRLVHSYRSWDRAR